MEKKQEEIWIEFCKQFKEKISEITSPVVNSGTRSREALTDVITNIILLEINIDRKPWNQIKMRDVKLSTEKEVREEVLKTTSEDELISALLEKVSSEISYVDEKAEDLTEEKLNDFALYTALKNYNPKNYK